MLNEAQSTTETLEVCPCNSAVPLRIDRIEVGNWIQVVCDNCGRRGAQGGSRWMAEKLWNQDRRCASTAPVVDTYGVRVIAKERQRQISIEGWTPEHDNEHTDESLARAGAVYALPDDYRERMFKNAVIFTDLPELWPWSPMDYKPDDDRIRELAKAGALIAAEIDRLARIDGIDAATAAPQQELRQNPRVNAMLVALRKVRDNAPTLEAAQSLATIAIEQYVAPVEQSEDQDQ